MKRAGKQQVSGPWFKVPRDLLRHPRARSLSLSAKGLWLMMLDIMDESSRKGVLLMDGQPVPDDVLASMAGVSPSELDDLIRELQTAGMLSIGGQRIIRCDWLTAHDKASQVGKANAKKRWEKRHSQDIEKKGKEQFGNGTPNGDPNGTPTAIDLDLEETSSLRAKPPASRQTDEDLDQALLTYHEAAERVGWPKVLRMTPKRKSALRSRLREAGGLDGWRAAMTRAERSSFLRGEKTNWRADFDFFLQPSSFLKVREGAYDDRPPSGLKAAPNPHVLEGKMLFRVFDNRCETQNLDGTWRDVWKTPAQILDLESVKQRGVEFDWTGCSPARAAELQAELSAKQERAA